MGHEKNCGTLRFLKRIKKYIETFNFLRPLFVFFLFRYRDIIVPNIIIMRLWFNNMAIICNFCKKVSEYFISKGLKSSNSKMKV
ncbi:hypothetical protein B566_EDAN016901 [Ephemera danica]|nr:hypothetical protein B566_EDAN016901 [Ephemera danica]